MTSQPLHVTYVLLSPTFGMHQYTADLANRMAAAGHHVRLVTTTGYPQDRYAPAVDVHTPLTATTTGFSLEGARLDSLLRVQSTLTHGALASLRPCVDQPIVHFTGVHLWNLPLVYALRRRRVLLVHTLHDLDPHYGRRFGGLIRLWNRLLVRSGCHLLVHGRRYRERLVAQGVAAERVTCVPLLHLFLGYEAARGVEEAAQDVRYEPWALFFGRLERYKGVDVLLRAQALVERSGGATGLRLAGSGSLERIWDGPLPGGVALRQGLIRDQEALELFRRCGVLVLPYRDGTQSALIAAAYAFRKPVIVTDVGAFAEYVEPGRTGWLVEAGDAAALARCLREALADPARLARMGEAGRAWYDRARAQEWEGLLGMYDGLTQGREGARAQGTA
jgi:glycosyltransferase involved in cell wall biosynthesis